MKLRIGTRRSALAQAQTRHIISLVNAKFPEVEFAVKFISTVADRDRVSEFHQFGITGVFTTEHEECLRRKDVDLVVHSLKDLPTTLMEGLVLAAVPERMDPRDALCGSALAHLPKNARVGTASLRRRAQIMALRRDVEVVPIRGNLQPRLSRTKGPSRLDAVILATAGLNRIDLGREISEILDPVQFPYAVGQGALGVEARGEDTELVAMLRQIECQKARAEVDAERHMMHCIGAGCSLPLGVQTEWTADRMTLRAQVTALNGEERIVAVAEGRASDPIALGAATAATMRERGGVKLLQDIFRVHCPHFKLN